MYSVVRHIFLAVYLYASDELKALCPDIRAIFSKLVSHVTQPHPLN